MRLIKVFPKQPLPAAEISGLQQLHAVAMATGCYMQIKDFTFLDSLSVCKRIHTF